MPAGHVIQVYFELISLEILDYIYVHMYSFLHREEYSGSVAHLWPTFLHFIIKSCFYELTLALGTAA